MSLRESLPFNSKILHRGSSLPEGFLSLKFHPLPVDFTVRELLPFRWALPLVESSPGREHPGIGPVAEAF